MDYAVDEMNNERTFIFGCFGVGILATLCCLLSAAWVLMEPEVAACASCLILSTIYLVISEARRIRQRFFLEEEEIVSFSELNAVFPQCAADASSAARRISDQQELRLRGAAFE